MKNYPVGNEFSIQGFTLTAIPVAQKDAFNGDSALNFTKNLGQGRLVMLHVKSMSRTITIQGFTFTAITAGDKNV